MEILIRSGTVYDPTNAIDGEVMDIAIKDGKIVEKVDESRAYVIDASKKWVMPGGVDLHSHIAGPKVNMGRILRPEDHYKDYEPKSGIRRSGVGYSIPSTFTTGYRYATMGYTTVFEPANPPMKMFHVHDELNDTPIVDKGAYPLFDNNWFVMEYLRDKKMDECAAYIAWTLEAVKGYALKLVDPGGVEAWKWGGTVDGLDDQVPRFGVTPREIIRGLCKVNKLLNLPHPLHVHANGLGIPGNYATTIKTMDCVRDMADDRPIIHLTHVQFNGYGGMDWASLSSGAEEIAKYVNANKHVSLDMGQVVFTDTTTMTADGPFEYQLHQITKNKWVNADVESETGCGLVPIHYRKSKFVHAVMWAIGLELALLAKDPWRVVMTTDHPNGGPFTSYPRVMSWLMSKKVRQKVLEKVPRLARARSNIESIDRELTFYEMAILTRAAPARLLNLREKGHLGVGGDADVSIYDLNTKEVDPSSEYRKVRRALKKAAYTIKNGEIVAKDGEIVKAFGGRTYWVRPKVPDDLMGAVKSELEEKFDDYYTIKFGNYQVPEGFLPHSSPVATASSLR